MKVVLSIAGSDSSGGAGIQADLKTFEAFDIFGTTAITVLTAQNTTGVTSINKLEPEFVVSQVKAVFDDFDVAAIKIGMLFSNEIIDAIREFIKDLSIPIVFDPVFNIFLYHFKINPTNLQVYKQYSHCKIIFIQ